jgi:hypothetical protein
MGADSKWRFGSRVYAGPAIACLALCVIACGGGAATTSVANGEAEAAIASAPPRIALSAGQDTQGELVAGKVGALRYSLAVEQGRTLEVSVLSKECTPIFFLRVPGMFDGGWTKVVGKPSRDPSTSIADFGTNDGPDTSNGLPQSGTVEITVTTQENSDARQQHDAPRSACKLTINADDFEP